MANRYAAHQKLIEDTMLACRESFPMEFRAWDRVTGKFYAKRVSKEGIVDYVGPYTLNKAGAPDMYGVFFLKIKNITLSVFVEMEFKTGNARLSKEQKTYRAFCQRFEIPWFEVRDPNQFIFDLKNRMESIKNNLLTQL